jgi:hypothetical protein
MSMLRKVEVYTIPDFLHRRNTPSFRRNYTPVILVTAGAIAAFHTLTPVASAATAASTGPVSSAFDAKIWPLFIDVGTPLAKTVIALGIYRCIRNDVDRGWKMIYRAGLGLVGLYLVDGAIHVLTGIGKDLQMP